ncbi:MAG: HU family DNA-binding protein [Rhodothermales bacterium]|nr:HU family DNA-binding protein [Rhodothermales bacterium]
MTKADIIDRVAAGTGLTKIETEAVINGFLTVLKDALVEEERIEIRGFGSFKVQERAPRIARNPRTNEEVEVEACYVPVFKPSQSFRAVVMDAARKRSRVKK